MIAQKVIERTITKEVAAIQEALADSGQDSDLKLAVTIHNRVFADSRVCPYQDNLRCREGTCSNCIIWMRWSGYLAQDINGGKE